MISLLKTLSNFVRSVVSNYKLVEPIADSTQSKSEKSELESQSAATADQKRQTALLEREIRTNRKFTLAEAIGREGGSFMKGESSIPRPLRATTRINQFITTHTQDPAGAFATTLSSWVTNDIRVSRQLDTPLVALNQVIESTLKEPTSFIEFFRQVAIAQSKLTGDRPYFQQLNQPPHPEADHTHDSIRAALVQLLQDLSADVD